MSPGAETSWHAIDPAGDAATIRGRPAHAFWPLLAPSFRWVLLPPHRRAGGGEIAWEWQGPSPAPRPSPTDLNDLRLRMRDGIELFEEELSRRDALPEGLSAEDLRQGIDRALHALRHDPDQVLAAHAVFTSRGWMVRSWGFARPAPAHTEAREAKAPPAAPPSVAAGNGPASPTRAPSERRTLRRWIAALLVGALVLGLVLGLRALRSKNKSPATELPPVPEASNTRPAPHPERPAKLETAGESNTRGKSGGAAAKDAQGLRAAPASPRSPTRDSPTAQTTALASTPLAITGPMPALPEAQVGLAGPPSNVPGKTGQPPVPALPRGSPPMETPPSSKAVPDMTPPPPSPASVSTAGEAPPTLRAPSPTPPPPVGEHREGKHAIVPISVLAPTPFSVEAREAPEPTPPPAPKAGATSKTAAASPGTAESEETAPSARHTTTPPPSDSATDDTKPFPSANAAPTATNTAPPGRAAINTAGLETVFRGHAMPWRLVLDRDAPLPTKPTEQDAEAEIRQARIVAWAEARARVPFAFRKREGRSGWSLRLATETPATRHARWLDERGSVLPVEQASLVNGEARITWRETDPRDVDALLVTEAGKALARVRRLAAENRIEVQATPAVLEVGAWFSLKLDADAGAEGISAPVGWSVQTEDENLTARGPAGALRMRWQHAASGWTLHGGYARENP